MENDHKPVAGLPVWFDRKALNLKKDQEEPYEELTRFLSSPNAGLMADILLSKPVSVSNAGKEMEGSVDRLISLFPMKLSSAMLVVLSRVVRRCNERAGLGIPLPEFAVRIPSAKNPFTADRWGGLSKIRRWRAQLVNEITKGLGIDDMTLAYGRLLASSVLLGGLISRNSLDALYCLLPDRFSHLEMAKGRMDVFWCDSDGNCSRWFPDVMTALLLVRLPEVQAVSLGKEGPGERGAREIRRALTSDLLRYMHFVCPSGEDAPQSLGELLDAALLELDVRMPRALTEYAAGRQISHSLPPAAWRRIMGSQGSAERMGEVACSTPGPESSAVKLDDGEPQGGNSDSNSEDEQGGEPESEPDWLRKLRAELRLSETSTVKTSITGRIERS